MCRPDAYLEKGEGIEIELVAVDSGRTNGLVPTTVSNGLPGRPGGVMFH